MFWGLLLFAKNMKFFTKDGIHCISRSSLGAFILCASVIESKRSAVLVAGEGGLLTRGP